MFMPWPLPGVSGGAKCMADGRKNAAISKGRVKVFRALDLATELFMAPTAELCDYVLPATSFLEMGDLAANFEHRPKGKLHLQYRPAAVPPLAERRSDTWMIFELAKRVGLGHDFWEGDTEATTSTSWSQPR